MNAIPEMNSFLNDNIKNQSWSVCHYSYTSSYIICVAIINTIWTQYTYFSIKDTFDWVEGPVCLSEEEFCVGAGDKVKRVINVILDWGGIKNHVDLGVNLVDRYSTKFISKIIVLYVSPVLEQISRKIILSISSNHVSVISEVAS